MEEEEKPNFDSIKHRSIESATDTSLLIKIKILIKKAIIILIFGIFVIIIGFFIKSNKSPLPKGANESNESNDSSKMILKYFLYILGLILEIIGIYFCITIKYKFEFIFQGQKLIVTIRSLCCSNIKQYFISKLDYIIIDQMYVENDDGSKENARSIGSEQQEIPSKIIINSIDEGYDEIFSGSGNPPLFTNDEVQFFNQFMKININKNNK